MTRAQVLGGEGGDPIAHGISQVKDSALRAPSIYRERLSMSIAEAIAVRATIVRRKKDGSSTGEAKAAIQLPMEISQVKDSALRLHGRFCLESFPDADLVMIRSQHKRWRRALLSGNKASIERPLWRARLWT